MLTGYVPPRLSDKPLDPLKFVFYTGPSMHPTLKPSDRLLIIPYDDRAIRCGDVIVFHPPSGDRKITHRVISLDSGEIRTRGDNNYTPDEWILTPDRIIGRVAYVQRGKKRLHIYGGPVGLLRATVLRLILVIRIGLYSLFHPIYLRLAQSGVFRQCFPAKLKTQVVVFKRPSGIELQLLMGKRIIGSRAPGESHWKIRPPFLLFIDEASLPAANSKHTANTKLT